MHDLEIGENGQVAFALRGKPAWHNLANVTFDESDIVSTSDMLSSALLSNWNVRLEQVGVPDGYRSVRDNYFVVRDNPFDNGQDVLAVVGDRYATLQNEDLFAFGDNLLDGSGYWESAGSIRQGRTVFGSLKLNRDIVIDPRGIADKTDLYLLVTTSHDGSSAVQAMTTPVRVVCQNTLNMALRGAKQSFKCRHSQTVEGRVAEAREALGLAFAYADRWEIEANELFNASLTDKQFADIVEALYPAPDRSASAKASITKYDDKVADIWGLYNGVTQTGIKGTAWGALNALTEKLDYGRKGRKGSDDGIMASASGFDVQTNAEKGRILSAVREIALA
jgi:phage/plasmid-like protein (TIGR03299 family)